MESFCTAQNFNTEHINKKQIDIRNNLNIILDVYSRIVTQFEKINYTFYIPSLLEMSNGFFCIIASLFEITFLIIRNVELQTIIFKIFSLIHRNLCNLSKTIILFRTITSIQNKVHNFFNSESVKQSNVEWIFKNHTPWFRLYVYVQFIPKTGLFYRLWLYSDNIVCLRIRLDGVWNYFKNGTSLWTMNYLIC